MTPQHILVAVCLCAASTPVGATPVPSAPPEEPAPPELPPNTLILIADDLGVDMVSAYAESNDAPTTPHIDRLAESGMLFRNAWTAPMCSPSRASIQTGRHPFRTGIGFVLADNAEGLADEEQSLAEMIDRYEPHDIPTALFGKWHLGGGVTGPLDQGYDHYSGYPNNLYEPQGYFSFTRYDDGVAVPTTTYATTDTVDRALEWIENAPEPWTCVVSFHAPHEPFHEPPSHLHDVDLTGADPRENPRPLYEAMVKALDTEIGRMMETLGEDLNQTNVFFMGDNGTPKRVSVPPFLPEHAKLTPYEGGINVPLLVRGPAVHQPGTECNGLVSLTDVYATVADLYDILPQDGTPIGHVLDGTSLVPYLLDPDMDSMRPRAYAGAFNPSSSGGPNLFTWHMIRNDRYKFLMVEHGEVVLEMYDLQSDPFEQTNLFTIGLSGEERLAFHEAVLELRMLLQQQ